MDLTDEEVFNLRESINRGGFILMEDFNGPGKWSQMQSQIVRNFPIKDFVPMDIDLVVFRTHAPLNNMQAMSDYPPGGSIT